MDPGADDGPAGGHRPQRDWHQLYGRREDDRGVQLLGRRVSGVTRPLRPHAAGEGLPVRVAGAGEGEYPPALGGGDLADDVRGRPEAVESEALGLSGQPQRPGPDQPGAQQRRGLGRRMVLGQREAEAGVGDGELGESAVDVATGEAGPRAEVLATGPAVAALAAGPCQPRHPGAGAQLGRPLEHLANDLVPEDHRKPGAELSVGQMKVGSAHAAGQDPQQRLAGPGPRVGHVLQLERRLRRGEDHRAHPHMIAASGGAPGP